jgi:hypothetical protein
VLSEIISAGTVALLLSTIYAADYALAHHGDDWSPEYRAKFEDNRRLLAEAYEILSRVRNDDGHAMMAESARIDDGSKKGDKPWMTRY